MHGRGYYGQPYAQYAHYNHPYAYLGQDVPAPAPSPPPMVAPPMPPMPMEAAGPITPDHPAHPLYRHRKSKGMHLSTGGFFQVALAVTVGLIGAGVVAGAAGAAAYKVAVRRGARGDIGDIGDGF